MPVRAVYAIAKMDDEEDAKSVSEVGKVEVISELKDSPAKKVPPSYLRSLTKCPAIFSKSHLILGAVITLSVVVLITAGSFLLTQSSKTEPMRKVQLITINSFANLPDSSQSAVSEDTYQTSPLPQAGSYYYNNRNRPTERPVAGPPARSRQQSTSSRASSRTDATWSPWSEWTNCSAQCRPGESQARSRQCQAKSGGPPYIDVQNCAKVEEF